MAVPPELRVRRERSRIPVRGDGIRVGRRLTHDLLIRAEEENANVSRMVSVPFGRAVAFRLRLPVPGGGVRGGLLRAFPHPVVRRICGYRVLRSVQGVAVRGQERALEERERSVR